MRVCLSYQWEGTKLQIVIEMMPAGYLVHSIFMVSQVLGHGLCSCFLVLESRGQLGDMK